MSKKPTNPPKTEPCAQCGGSGKCPMCGGKGYLADGYTYGKCPLCWGSKICISCQAPAVVLKEGKK